MNSQQIKYSKLLSTIKFSFLIVTIALFSNVAFAQSTSAQGIALYEKGDYANAINILEKDDDNISSLYYLGLAYEKNNDTKSAEEAYVKSINKAEKLVIKQLRKQSKVGDQSDRKRLRSKYGSEIDNAFLAFGRYGKLNPEIYTSTDWQNKVQTLSIYAKDVSEDDKFYFDNEITSKIKVTSKIFAGYTKEARRNGITGRINVLVGFMKDGNIGMAIPLNTLGNGLTENAVNAARGIKFIPALKDGKPVNSAKIVRYDFSIF